MKRSLVFAYVLVSALSLGGCSGSPEEKPTRSSSAQTAQGFCVINATTPVVAYGSIYAAVDYANLSDQLSCRIRVDLHRYGPNDDDYVAQGYADVPPGARGTLQASTPCDGSVWGYYSRAFVYDEIGQWSYDDSAPAPSVWCAAQ